MDSLGFNILGVVVFILDIMALIQVITGSRPVIEKVLISVMILAFPLIGVLIYYFFMNKRRIV